MSSPYAILNNRPVDQWKVTELREELKRRKLKTNGLKEDLVKRLDGALRLEMEDTQEAESDNGSIPDSDEVVEEKLEASPAEISAEPVDDKSNQAENDTAMVENIQSTVVDDQGTEDQGWKEVGHTALDAAREDTANNAVRLEMEDAQEAESDNGSIPDSDPVDKVDEEELAPAQVETDAEPVGAKVDEVVEEISAPPPVENSAEPVEAKVYEVIEEKLEILEASPAEISAEPVEDKSNQDDNDTAMVDNIQSTVVDDQGTEDQDWKEVGHAALDAAREDTTNNAVPLENSETGASQLESSDQAARYDEKNEDSKPSSEDAALSVSDPTNQVPEVSPDLGFQVKSESISTDSVSINEKNELKDNLNANNVNLEQEVVKPEMVQPSSSDILTIGGDSQPFEDDKELVDNQTSMEEAGDITCAADMELCKKIEGVDGGSSEKLNLDRSSGDESMEEDVLESKQIESKNNSEEGERKEDIKDDMVEFGKPIDALVGGFSPEKKRMIDSQEETKPIAAADKRKAEDQETVTINNEPKRQRRWNSDAAKAPEPQTANVTASTPKDAFQPALRRSFSRSDSSLSGDAPKERIVPPSQKPATTSLRIDRFLRPFTLKAVQELLGKTGTVTDFWMDQIKTHCYVTYSSVEEATATRNALYNLQWPTNGGRQLVAEFVQPQEVKMRLEAPPLSPAPVTPSSTTPTAPPFQRLPQAPTPSRPNLRQQQLPLPPPLPPPPALSNPPLARERLLPPPPPPKKPDPPIMTLDDLFKKTKATPRIYYLPLSEEQVAAKLKAAEQGK